MRGERHTMPRVMLTVHHHVKGSREELQALRRVLHDIWNTDQDCSIPLDGNGASTVLASNVLAVGEIEED
jgi:hypothetical protein